MLVAFWANPKDVRLSQRYNSSTAEYVKDQGTDSSSLIHCSLELLVAILVQEVKQGEEDQNAGTIGITIYLVEHFDWSHNKILCTISF